MAGGEVKRFKFGAGGADSLVCRMEPLRPVLDRFNALLREADERDVGRHGVSSYTWCCGSAPLRFGDCRSRVLADFCGKDGTTFECGELERRVRKVTVATSRNHILAASIPLDDFPI